MAKNNRKIIKAYHRFAIATITCAMIASTTCLPISAIDNFTLNKNEQKQLSYSIGSDATYVAIKQSTWMIVITKDELSDEEKNTLIQNIRHEDKSNYESINIVGSGNKIEYRAPDGKGGGGIYTVDFNEGTVSVNNKEKISHLNYGSFNPDPEPQPKPDPDPEIIVNENIPLINEPEEVVEEIEDEETPLTDAPVEEVIEDNETPLAEAPAVETIDDEVTPLAAAPQTGVTSSAGAAALPFMVAAAAIITFFKRRRNQD